MSYKDGFRWEIIINGKKVEDEGREVSTDITYPLVQIISNEIRKGCLNCYGKHGKDKWEVVCDMENGDEPQTNILNYIADEIEKGEIEGGHVIADIDNGYDHKFRMFDWEKKIFFKNRYDKERPHHNSYFNFNELGFPTNPKLAKEIEN